MSAFVCILDRSGDRLDRQQLQRLAEPLEVYGGALSTMCHGPVGVAVRNQGDSPFAAGLGRRAGSETGLVIALAGRYSAAGKSRVQPGTAAKLEAFQHQDDNFLAGISGSFVAIVANPEERWLSVVRDHLGDLKAYYYLDRRWLIAASEPAAILRHGAISKDLDESSVARFLGFRFSQSQRSFFRDIKELPPAHRLRVATDCSRLERYWRLRSRRSGTSSREEVGNEFLGHLRQSVANHLEAVEPSRVALSLSGGLDSTTLRALVPRGVRAFSWYFEDAIECDERGNIEAVAEQSKVPVHWVNGDGLYPLSGEYIDRFVHENSPYFNVFAALKCELYRTARAEGCGRIMVGDGGDALFAARDYWLRDALVDGVPRALTSLRRTIREAGRGDRLAKRALRRLLPIPRIRGVMGPPRLPWLTEAGKARLPARALSPILPRGGRRRRSDLIAGAKHTELESEERRLFDQCGVERSNPFWHWPLVEMAVNLPAYWSHRDGKSKVLTREAMRGLLPRRVLEAERAGLLGSFFLRGIESKRRELLEMVFRHPISDWQRYVRRSWLEPYLEAASSVQFGHTILWRVISYELWCRRLIRAP